MVDSSSSRDALLTEVESLRARVSELESRGGWVEESEPRRTATFDAQGRDINARLLEVLIKGAQEHGATLLDLLEGTGLTPSELRASRKWLSWSEYSQVLENVPKLVPREHIPSLGQRTFDIPGVRFLTIVSRAMTTEWALYRWLLRQTFGASGHLIRCVVAKPYKLAEDRFELRFSLPEGHLFPEVFPLGVANGLEFLPTLLGKPPARVDHQHDGDELRFVIQIQASRPGIGPRVLGAVRRVFDARGAVRELEHAYELLLERNQELALQLEELRRSERARELLEDRLREAQKLEAIGRLAGGVAHDFNNLLTVILSHCELLRIEDLPPKVDHGVEQIRAAGNRAAQLTRQLLAFSRQQVMDLRPLDLNRTLDSLKVMLQTLAGDAIELELELEPQLGTVEADNGQLERVIVNLVANARDAMEESGGGRIVLETANVTFDESYVEDHPGASLGPHVMLAVTDEGCGMDPATRAQAFEPFFTTKPLGKGTGLGLSTVYGIIRQFGGSIWLESEPGRGTTIKTYLPRVDAEARQKAEATSPGPPARRDRPRTVLVVEDQDSVREVAVRCLRSAGYATLDAPDAERAIELARTHDVDVVLTDIVMPGQSGIALAEELRGMQPELKVLLMSGYANEGLTHGPKLEPGQAFIQKPFSPRSLADAVEALLAGE